MNHLEFRNLLIAPDKVSEMHLSDLKEIVREYPYFSAPHLLLAKSMQMSDSVLFASVLPVSTIYTSQTRWFYYYLYPEQRLSDVTYKPERVQKSGGDYFHLMNVVEAAGGDTKATLKNMAEKLRSAREMVVENKLFHKEGTARKVKEKLSPFVMSATRQDSNSEEEILAKRYITESRYEEAIEILKQLYLNNPKKSVYFADQIRFLEKVIEKSKK